MNVVTTFVNFIIIYFIRQTLKSTELLFSLLTKPDAVNRLMKRSMPRRKKMQATNNTIHQQSCSASSDKSVGSSTESDTCSSGGNYRNNCNITNEMTKCDTVCVGMNSIIEAGADVCSTPATTVGPACPSPAVTVCPDCPTLAITVGPVCHTPATTVGSDCPTPALTVGPTPATTAGCYGNSKVALTIDYAQFQKWKKKVNL